jgi:hypothetical protein
MNDGSSGSTNTGRFLDGCLAIAESVDRLVFTGSSARDDENREDAPQST